MLVAPADRGARRRASSRVLGDPARARRLAAAARQYAQTHLGWGRFVDSVDDALRGGGAACRRLSAARSDRLGHHPGPQRRPHHRAADPSRARSRRPPAGPSKSCWWTTARPTTRPPSRARAGARVLELGDRGRAAATRRWRGTAAPWPPPAIRSSSSMPTACRRPAGWPGCSRATTPARRSWAARSTCRAGLSPMARCDYYCGWYHVHSRRPGRRGAQSSARQPERSPRGLRAPPAASPSSSRWPTRTRSWPGRRRCAGRGGRIVFDPRGDRLPLQPARASATCSAATTAGASAPSRARRRPARPAAAWVYRYPALLRGRERPAGARERRLHRGLLGPGGHARAGPDAAGGARRARWPTRRAWSPAASGGCGSGPPRRRRGRDGSDQRRAARFGRDAVPQRGRGDRALHREDPADLRRGGHRRRDRGVRQRLDRRLGRHRRADGRAGGAPAAARLRQRLPQGVRERARPLPRDGRRGRHLRLHDDPAVPHGAATATASSS